jgi:vancomycin resistance protein VanW
VPSGVFANGLTESAFTLFFMMNDIVMRPIKRRALRSLLGKEYFILKRKIHWLFHSFDYAGKIKGVNLAYSVIRHRSFLLRPLKNVDMYLQHNKVRNLQLAINKIHGVVILPGQTLSLWRLVGRPTKSKGYLNGLALENGRITKGIGGGLCQLGNLIYWMALHSPLSITERWRHGYDVFPDINRTIPFACGATLSYNYVDLQIKNNTNSTFQIDLWLDAEYLNGEIKGDIEPEALYSVFETDHHIKHQWWGGYTRHNKIWKRCQNKKTGICLEELVSENNAILMYPPLLDSSRG